MAGTPRIKKIKTRKGGSSHGSSSRLAKRIHRKISDKPNDASFNYQEAASNLHNQESDTKLLRDIQIKMKDISEEYKREDFSHVVKAAKVIYKQQDVDDVLSDLDNNIRRMKECVTQIVDVNYEGFHESIKNFSKILMNIQHSQEKISKLEEDINQTESLLKSRADNLPELYQRYLQHSEFLRILSKIQKVKNSVVEIDNAQSTNHFLAATQMILSTEELLNSSELVEIAALAGIKDDLKAHRQLMPNKLFEIVQKKYMFTGKDEKRQHDKRIHNEAFTDPVGNISNTLFGSNDSRSTTAALRMRRMSRITPQQMASHTMDVTSNPLISRRRRGGSRRSQLSHEQLLDQEKKLQELETDDLSLDYMNKNPPLFVSHCVKAIFLLDQTREAEFAFVQSLQKNINTLIAEHCQESVVKYMKSERYFNLQRTLQSMNDRDSMSIDQSFEMSNFKRSTIEKHLFTEMMKGLNDKLISVLSNSKDVLHNLKYQQKYKHHQEVLTKDMILRFRTGLIMDEPNIWCFKDSKHSVGNNPALQNLYQSTIIQLRNTLDSDNNTLVEPGVTTYRQLIESFQIISNDLNSQGCSKNSLDILTEIFTNYIGYVFDPNHLGDRFKLDLNYIWTVIQNELVHIFTNLFDVKVNEEDEKQKAKNAKEKAAQLAKAPVLKFSLSDYNDVEGDDEENTKKEKSKKADDMELLRNQLTGIFESVVKKSIYNYVWLHKLLEELINECYSVVDSENDSKHIFKNYLSSIVQPHLIKIAESDNRRIVNHEFHSEEWHQPSANNPRVMNVAEIVLEEFKALMLIRENVPPLSVKILSTIMTLFENVYHRITTRFSKECHGTGVAKFMKGFNSPEALRLTLSFANRHNFKKNDLVDAFEKREINLDNPHYNVIESSPSLIFISILSTTFRYIVDQLLEYASRAIIKNGVSAASKRRSMSQEEYNVKKHQLLENRRKSRVVLSIGQSNEASSEKPSEKNIHDEDYLEKHDSKFQKKFEEVGLKELYEIVKKYHFVSKHSRACLRLNFRLHFIRSVVPSLKSSDYSKKSTSLKQRKEEAQSSSSFADGYITRYTLDLRRMWNCVELYIAKDELHLLIKDFEYLIRYIFIEILSYKKDKRFSNEGIERIKRNLFALQQSYSALVHQTQAEIDFQAFTDITNYYDLLRLRTKELFAYLKHQIDECCHNNTTLPYEPEQFATILKTIGPHRTSIDPTDQKKLNKYLKSYNPHPQRQFVHPTATPEVDVDSNVPDPSELSAIDREGTMTEDYHRTFE